MTNKKSKNKLFIFLGIVIVVSLAVLIWFIFNHKPNFTGERVSFDIVGSRNIQSGGLVEYRLLYKNEEEVALRNMEISVIYPEGFSFESSSEKPENSEGNRWQIRKISPKSEEEIMISGKLYGNPDEIKKCKALFNYTPGGISSSFQEESEISTKILKTNLIISSNFPKLTSLEDNINYSVKVKNGEDFKLSNLRVKIEYPADFELSSKKPEASSENKIWNFNEVASGQEIEIKIEEKVMGKLEEEKKLNVEAGVFDREGHYYKQKEEIFGTKISKIDANINYTVLGKENISARPNEELDFKINYKNTGTETLPGVKVETEIDKGLFEEKSIAAEGGRYMDGKIVWNSEGIPSFKNLKKEQGGDLKFKAKLKNNIDSEKVQDPIMKSKAKILSNNSETGVKIEKESNEIEIRIGTVISLESIGRFYDFDNKKIGFGPIPPKVGETTKYRVYLFVSNTTSEVFDGKVEIELPTHVSWTGVKDVKTGSLSFINSKLIWNIGKIEKNLVGKDLRLEANFEIGITPSIEQKDSVITLVNKVIFSGKDSHTKETISTETKSINTELKDDPNIKERDGIVVGGEEDANKKEE